MSEDSAFTDLIRRVRGGDDQAAAELVRSYEPEIRREIRFRLGSPQLRRVVDSVDVCQSVLASFFVRAAAGQYDLDRPDQLLRLFVAMARNKLADQVRQQHAQRRDDRRLAAASPEEMHLAAAGESPSQIVAGRELFRELRKRLSEEERRIAELRADGKNWGAIASELGGTAEGRRKQLARAADRIARQLGLDEGSHE